MSTQHPITDEVPVTAPMETVTTPKRQPEPDDLDATADEIREYIDKLGPDAPPDAEPKRAQPEPERTTMPFTPTDPIQWPDPSATTRTVHDWPPDVVGPLLVDRLGIDRLRRMTHDERVEALRRTIERLVVDAVTPHDHIEAANLMAWRVDVRLHEHDPNVPPPIRYDGPTDLAATDVPAVFEPD